MGKSNSNKILPISEEEVRKLSIGEIIYISGIVVTARDKAHEKAISLAKRGEKLPVDFSKVALFHCGPIMRKEGKKWIVIAAGPTTSARMELFEDEFIRLFGTRIIIGKGGMGDRTAKMCAKYGCVYCAFTGGAAVLGAKSVKEVKKVFWFEELGMPECLWVFEVEKFGPLIVTIDAKGRNLTELIKEEVENNKERAYKIIGLNEDEN